MNLTPRRIRSSAVRLRRRMRSLKTAASKLADFAMKAANQLPEQKDARGAASARAAAVLAVWQRAGAVVDAAQRALDRAEDAAPQKRANPRRKASPKRSNPRRKRPAGKARRRR